MKYVLYARTSSDVQRRDETVHTQLDVIAGWAKRERVSIEEKYIDDGVTSRISFAERPAAADLLRDAARSRFTHLVVYDYKRLGRTQLDTLQTIEDLRSHGVEIVSVREPLPDSSGSIVNLMRSIFTAFGQYDRDAIRANSVAGKERRAREGYWQGGPPPFGYRLEAGRLALDHAQAETVRLIFRLYTEEGYSLKQVARYLLATGAPSARGGRWEGARISKILRAEVSAGVLVWRKTKALSPAASERMPAPEGERLSGPTPAIVTREEWEAAQSKLARGLKNSRRNGIRFYLLRGLLRCAHKNCGRAYVGLKVSRSHESEYGPYYYYRCASVYGAGGKCENGRVSAPVIEEDVWARVIEWVNEPGKFVAQIALAGERRLDAVSTDEELARLGSLLAVKSRERAKLVRLIAQERITENEGVHALEELRAEEEALAVARRKLERRGEEMRRQAAYAEDVRRFLVQYQGCTSQADGETKRNLIERLIEKIEVEGTDKNGCYKDYAPELTIYPRLS